jgi:hypothetical protein
MKNILDKKYLVKKIYTYTPKNPDPNRKLIPISFNKIPIKERINEWLSFSKYVPDPFELLYLKEKRSDKPEIGWWNGSNWVGVRLKKNNYNYWKFKREIVK